MRCLIPVNIFLFILGVEMQGERNLRLVRIYFDTATYDEVERDEKIKTEAQVSLIGGTMGLFTGFSIISGIEIIFFLAKFFYKSMSRCKEMISNKDKNKEEDENIEDDNNDKTAI